ncbi:MAG: hypothetical protein ABIM40_11295 [Pseudomonadota bacterium]
MTRPVASRIPCAFFDAYMEIFATLIICEIHLVLEWKSGLDPERLGRALCLVLDAEPVLGCRFVPRWAKPYWERLGPVGPDRVLEHRQAPEKDPEAPAREFFATELDPAAGPQIRALLLSGPEGDRLLLKINHQVADAAGVKQLTSRLSHIYQRLEIDPGYRPSPNLGPRGLDQIFRPLLPGKAPRLLRLFKREAKNLTDPLETTVFPAGREKKGPFRVVLHELSARRMEEALRYGSSRGATLNDLLVTAYARALARQLDWKGEHPLRVAGTVDLRRYLEGRETPGLCNLSSLYAVNLEKDPGRDFGETLSRVKGILDQAKKNYIGLPLLFGGAASIWPMPFGLKRALIPKLILAGSRRNNHPPAFTNMGALDPELLSFGKPDLEGARLLVPASRPPFFVMGVSGFSGGLSLSAGVFESSIPASRVEELFSLMDQELPGYGESPASQGLFPKRISS